MKRKYLIIVEGKADVNFIKDYLKYILKDYKLNVIEKKDICIDFEDVHIKFLVSQGYTVVQTPNLITRLKSECDQLYNLVMIQDADDPTKENGGVKIRMQYLNDIQKENKINFETFLFPNHKDDGDLETLLLNIAKKEKYNSYFSNYVNYAELIKTFSEEKHCLELLQNKFRVFNYFQVYSGMHKAKEENREFSEDFWDMSSSSLNEFNSFLSRVLKLGDLKGLKKVESALSK